jgi:hypothetical protein
MLPANQRADMEIDGGDVKRQDSPLSARETEAAAALSGFAPAAANAPTSMGCPKSDGSVNTNFAEAAEEDAFSQRIDAGAVVSDDGLESCTDEEDTADGSAQLTDEAAKSELAHMKAYMEDCHKGKFRRTTGCPRKLDGVLWDRKSAESFRWFCWRCSRSKGDGGDYIKVVMCEGICRRSFHPCCMKAKEGTRYGKDKKASWLCEQCLLGRFPKPLRSKAQVQAREHIRSPLGAINSNDPLQRTHLMIAIEENRLRDDSKSADADGVVTEPAYLSHLLNTAGATERNVRSNINQPDAERFTALHYAVRPECLTDCV